MKKSIFICMMLILVACTSIANAADWPENINGRWLNGGGRTTVDPYGNTWYIPDHVYEFQLNGDQLVIKIVELGIYNKQKRETRSPQNFLYFDGTLKGNRIQGRSRAVGYDHLTGRNLRALETYDNAQTVAISGDGNTLYWGNMEFRRE